MMYFWVDIWKAGFGGITNILNLEFRIYELMFEL